MQLTWWWGPQQSINFVGKPRCPNNDEHNCVSTPYACTVLLWMEYLQSWSTHLSAICTFFSHSQSDGYNLKLHYQCTEHLDIVYNSRYFKFVVIALLKQPVSCIYYVVCYYITRITQRAIWLPNLAASLLVCSRSIQIKIVHQSQSWINESPTFFSSPTRYSLGKHAVRAKID